MFLGERPKGSWGAWPAPCRKSPAWRGGTEQQRCPKGKRSGELHTPGHPPLALFLSEALGLHPQETDASSCRALPGMKLYPLPQQ